MTAVDQMLIVVLLLLDKRGTHERNLRWRMAADEGLKNLDIFMIGRHRLNDLILNPGTGNGGLR